MRKRLLAVLAALAAASAFAVVLNDTQIVEGRQYRVIQTNNREVTGQVRELPDGRYEITTNIGTIWLHKNQVRKIVPVEESSSDRSGGPAGARRRITDADIEQILGSDNIEIGLPNFDDQVDLRAPLDMDTHSVQEMLRIAGRNAKILEKPHFVLVYTSDAEQAQELGSRLEAVYEWAVKYMEMLDIPRTTRPESKLEVFFFGTYEEYEAYQTLNGWSDLGAIGFYMRTNNRSAFFDMTTWPPYKVRLDRAKDPSVPWRERQRLKNTMARIIEHKNLEVIQHEAGHHIHFNIGIYPKGGDVPTWMVEGLAQMFEVPPSEVGGSLGATNHYRLALIRQLYGERGEGLPPMRQFILNDGLWYQLGGAAYPIGWALVHYLYHEHREAYAQWAQLLAQRPDDFGERVDVSTKQEQFEEFFGEIDDEWIQDFKDYIAGIQLKRSVLPPDLP
jgi:hypothetical protein